MAIPPQLACKLSDHAAAVQEFCNMAPEIPWTNQMLDDMLDSLNETVGVSTEMQMTPPVHGLTKIHAQIMVFSWKLKKKVKRDIRAIVSYYGGMRGFEIPNNLEKNFDFDRAGLRNAICFLQKHTQNVKRRGLCEACLTGERPTKRLRVSDTNLCSHCLLKKAVF